MHITDLQIDRFGIWRDLTLPLAGRGLNVFYGPNEAGKSTLMRFIKAMLYGGIPPHAEADGPMNLNGPPIASGSLRIEDAGASYRIRRQLTADGASHVQIIGPGEAVLPSDRIEQLLGGTSESVFDRVFAVDLYELQELATLDHDELAEHVYGISLEARGLQLLASVESLRARRRAILSECGRTGRLARMLDQEASLLDSFRKLPDLSALQGQLEAEREQLDSEIASLKHRKSELRNELRGRRFLDRVHPAWMQVREYSAELESLPPAAGLSDEGLARLTSFEQEGRSLRDRYRELRGQAEHARRRLEKLGDVPEIVKAESAVRALLGMRDWLQQTIADRDAAAKAGIAAADAARVAREQLGPDWNEARLGSVDVSPSAQLRLMNAAREYRLALGRRAAIRKRYKLLRRQAIKRDAEVQERLEHLGQSPEESIAAVRRRLASLEKLIELRATERALAKRGGAIRQRFESSTEAFDIPAWVSLVLAMFAVGGAAFAFLGFITGVTTSVVAGIAYLLLGITAGCIAAKLRSHFGNAAEISADEVRDAHRRDEIELRQTREEIARLSTETGFRAESGNAAQSSSAIAGAIDEATKELATLERLVRERDRTRQVRKRLSALRVRLGKLQQTVEAARQRWCETLVKLGLAESLDVEATLALWQQIAEVRAADNGAISEHFDRCDAALRTFSAQLRQIAAKIGVGESLANRPIELLDLWKRTLDDAERGQSERRELRESYRMARREASRAVRRLRNVRKERRACLAEAGVESRAEYVARLQSDKQRGELEELLALAEAELDSLAEAEPELAIFEDDLVSFDPQANADILNRLAREQEEIEARLETAHERRGSLLRRIDELASDNRAPELRRRLSRLSAVMHRTTARLLALSVAERAAEQARLSYERDRQPPVLAAASESLARLTRNRYVRIWVPLGERSLRIDDDQGRTFSVEQLSGGTREQLFLALRLGLVKRSFEQGVELPLILDDVFVNFDQLRTEAAFETLRDFAEQGHQVLFFTCHLHLAHLAEHRGIEPIWLPGHQPPMQQRLAG